MRQAKQTRKARSSASGTPPPQTDVPVTTAGDGGAVSVSNLSLHDLFEQQARNMLERANIDEEQKQSILVAMACPCCGGGGMSFSVKLKEGA